MLIWHHLCQNHGHKLFPTDFYSRLPDVLRWHQGQPQIVSLAQYKLFKDDESASSMYSKFLYNAHCASHEQTQSRPVNSRVNIGWQTTPASLVCGQLLEAGGLEAQSTSLLSKPSQTTLSRKTPPEPWPNAAPVRATAPEVEWRTESKLTGSRNPSTNHSSYLL